MADLSKDDCATIAEVLADAVEKIPVEARAVRMRLITIAREHTRAARFHAHAEGDELHPQIRAAGSLEPGECIQLGGGVAKTRRVTDTGIEIMLATEGKWSWENVSSRTTPVCVVDTPREFAR